MQHELQATRIVLDVDEDEVAAQLAEDVEPTRDAHALALQLVELARDLLGLMRPLERGRVGAHAGGLETVELGQARRADTIGLLRAVTTLGHNGVQASSRPPLRRLGSETPTFETPAETPTCARRA